MFRWMKCFCLTQKLENEVEERSAERGKWSTSSYVIFDFRQVNAQLTYLKTSMSTGSLKPWSKLDICWNSVAKQEIKFTSRQCEWRRTRLFRKRLGRARGRPWRLDRVKKAVKLQNGVSVRWIRTFLHCCKQTASGRYTLSTHCYSSIES